MAWEKAINEVAKDLKPVNESRTAKLSFKFLRTETLPVTLSV